MRQWQFPILSLSRQFMRVKMVKSGKKFETLFKRGRINCKMWPLRNHHWPEPKWQTNGGKRTEPCSQNLEDRTLFQSCPLNKCTMKYKVGFLASFSVRWFVHYSFLNGSGLWKRVLLMWISVWVNISIKTLLILGKASLRWPWVLLLLRSIVCVLPRGPLNRF